MTRVCRPSLAAGVALLLAAMPAVAVWVDPITPQAAPPAASSPPRVEDIEGPAAAAPPPLLPRSVVLDHALAAAEAHLLITGRPVQIEDRTVAPEPDSQGGVETSLRYHPATLFEGAMGIVIVLVAVSLVWLPRLRRGRRHGHRRRGRPEGHQHRRRGQPARDDPPGKVRARVRRRSRRAPAG